MTGFWRDRGQFVCDGIALAEIAREAGTPVHVYSGALIDQRYRALDAALGAYPHRLHYAIKANSTLAVVRRLRQLGAGADANSGGEIEVALRAGFLPSDVVFTGVGKTSAELERAVGLGVAAINAESPGEVDRIAGIALAMGKVANVAVRINPDIEAGSHPHISTGHRATKFGMAAPDAMAMLLDVATRPSLRIVGLHAHIGSQITQIDPIARAARTLVDLARQLSERGIAIDHLDVGGGLGIAYAPGQSVVSVEDYAKAVLAEIGHTGLGLVLEPGRWIVGPAGVLVTQVIDVKGRPDGGSFVIVDAGMTDLIRPALYGAWHEIEPAAPPRTGTLRADVVGPVCETTDTLASDRTLPAVEAGDLLVVRDTGAYGAVMSSNYNRRPTAAEVMVEHRQWGVVRRRQTIDDMLQWDE